MKPRDFSAIVTLDTARDVAAAASDFPLSGDVWEDAEGWLFGVDTSEDDDNFDLPALVVSKSTGALTPLIFILSLDRINAMVLIEPTPEIKEPAMTRPARIPHSFDLTGGAGSTIHHEDGTTTTIKGNPPSYSAVGYSLTNQPQTVAQLADAAQVSRSATSKALKQLEKQGLAERDSSTSPETWMVGMPQSAPRKAPVPDGWARLGSIREEVLVCLAEAAGAPMTPFRMSQRTGRSAGAIENACRKMVEEGEVTLASPKPRTYAAQDGR